jgi:hypothetical protein
MCFALAAACVCYIWDHALHCITDMITLLTFLGGTMVQQPREPWPWCWTMPGIAFPASGSVGCYGRGMQPQRVCGHCMCKCCVVKLAFPQADSRGTRVRKDT